MSSIFPTFAQHLENRKDSWFPDSLRHFWRNGFDNFLFRFLGTVHHSGNVIVKRKKSFWFMKRTVTIFEFIVVAFEPFDSFDSFPAVAFQNAVFFVKLEVAPFARISAEQSDCFLVLLFLVICVFFILRHL